jgi:hypothetical protein
MASTSKPDKENRMGCCREKNLQFLKKNILSFFLAE